jgi:hypothetical protein
MNMDNWDRPEVDAWGAKWGALMGWALRQQYPRDKLAVGPGGETGAVDELLRRTFE